MRKIILWLFIAIAFQSCKKTETTIPIPEPTPDNYYYPPLTGDVWETKNPVSIGWNEALIMQVPKTLTD